MRRRRDTAHRRAPRATRARRRRPAGPATRCGTHRSIRRRPRATPAPSSRLIRNTAAPSPTLMPQRLRLIGFARTATGRFERREALQRQLAQRIDAAHHDRIAEMQLQEPARGRERLRARRARGRDRVGRARSVRAPRRRTARPCRFPSGGSRNWPAWHRFARGVTSAASAAAMPDVLVPSTTPMRCAP